MMSCSFFLNHELTVHLKKKRIHHGNSGLCSGKFKKKEKTLLQPKRLQRHFRVHCTNVVDRAR